MRGCGGGGAVHALFLGFGNLGSLSAQLVLRQLPAVEQDLRLPRSVLERQLLPVEVDLCLVLRGVRALYVCALLTALALQLLALLFSAGAGVSRRACRERSQSEAVLRLSTWRSAACVLCTLARSSHTQRDSVKQLTRGRDRRKAALFLCRTGCLCTATDELT